jgi:GTP-binding protein
MDSNTLEKERGITIFSKTASISYKDFRINIVDTPGHADFGGEVERVLSMVDGCVLVVDASEGPMTQTRFVLNKALNRNLKTVVVLNKADRPTTRLDEVQSEILDLFLNLNAADDQLDYPVLFASAKEGWAVKNWDDDKKADMNPLFEQIISSVPSPKLDRSKPFSMLVTQLESDPFVGRCVLGRIQSGSISVGDKIKCLDENGKIVGEGKVLKMFSRDGLSKEIIEHAGAGEIISIAGVPMAGVNITLCDSSISEPIESVPIDPPTVSMVFSVNDSPLQGEHGSKLTSGMIRDRLMKEIETNVAMQVIESDQKDSFEVRGRGELHLGVLIENMRREGFELSVSPPRVIMKKTDNQLLEPMEEVSIDVPLEYGGAVIQKLNKRKGEMKNYVEQGDRLKLSFEIPSRGLLGYVSEFKNETSGQGYV